MRRILSRSVFKPMPRGMAMNDVLAILFHRSAATVYMLYALWAIVSFIPAPNTASPVTTEELGYMIGRVIFPLVVLILSTISGIGAIFWPVMARVELFAGSAFCASLLIYSVLTIGRAIEGTSSWSSVVLIFAVIVLPVARTVIVYLFLVRQAEERKRHLGE